MPLSLTGTPEEIDAELPHALTEFAESHVKLQKTVEKAKEQIATAVREIQEREREKNKSKTTAASAAKPEERKEKPAAGGELLPLWCKPPSDPGATASGASVPAPGAEAALHKS